MANLRSDELRAICQVLGISRDGTVPILVLNIRAKLVEMSLVQPKVIAQAPVAYGGPKINQPPAITPAPKITAQMPPDAPPLTDSDDDIVITVEPI